MADGRNHLYFFYKRDEQLIKRGRAAHCTRQTRSVHRCRQSSGSEYYHQHWGRRRVFAGGAADRVSQ